MVSPIPTAVMIHEVDYEEYTGNDDAWSGSYLAPVTVQNVLVQSSSEFYRSSDSENVGFSSILFYDPGQSTPAVNFVEGSKLTFKGDTMTVTKVLPVYAFDPKIPHHVEVELS